MSPYKTAIIVLNYNNYRDTISCIQSILANDISKHNCSLIVIDNASTDDSYNEISNYLKSLSYPLNEYNDDDLLHENSLNQICFINSSRNKGYASGNNLGLKLALLDETINNFWILNNDTELDSNCLEAVTNYCEKHKHDKLILGTLLARYYEKNILQLLGAKYSPIFGKGRAIYPNFPLKNLSSKVLEETEKKMNYIIGASILFSRKFLTDVGLFNEKYFLYCEEIDIIQRSKKFGYKLKIIQGAIVYHKEGGTTNVQLKQKQNRNPFIEYHNSRSKLIFSKLYYPFFYPITLVSVITNLFIIYRNNIKKGFDISIKLILNKAY